MRENFKVRGARRWTTPTKLTPPYALLKALFVVCRLFDFDLETKMQGIRSNLWLEKEQDLFEKDYLVLTLLGR